MDYTNVSSQSSLSKITKRIKSLQELFPFTRKKIKAKRIRARISQNAQVAINQLPVELLIKIISFAARPSIQRPYPYVVFSSVCRYWRSAILDNAIFWKTIAWGAHGIDPMFVEELIKRSRNAPLNVVINRLNFSDMHALFLPQFLSAATRVKTLYLNLYWNPSTEYSRLSDLISSFPLLENIFFYSPRPVDVNSLPTCIQIQVKEMQISIEHLGNLAIPGHFRELSWLSLKYEMDSIPLLSVLEALHNLPNLQVLRLFWSSSRGIPETAELAENHKSILTLPKLAVLISNISILHLIHAPKLLYLDIIPQYAYPVPSPNNDTYDRLCGFDFSGITHICCGMEKIHGIGPSHTMWGPTYRLHKSHNTSQFFPRKYRNNNGLEWIFDDFPSDLNYPNEFYLALGGRDLWEPPPPIIPILILYIEKATNLVEIVLDFHSFSPNQTDIESLSTALRSATTVRNLVVISGSISLQTLCDLLSDGDLVPSLERLSYITFFIHKDEFSSYIPNSLQKLKERRGTLTRGLEIELKGFHFILSQDLEGIEKLGFLRREGTAGNCFNFFISNIGSSIEE